MQYESLWVNIRSKKYVRRKLKPPSMFKGKKERYFLESIVEEFHKHGWLVHHHDTYKPRYAWIIGPGFPDLVLTKKIKRNKRLVTVVLYAEVKLEYGYPSLQQKNWLNRLPRNTTFLWRPSHWKEIGQIAKSYGLQSRKKSRKLVKVAKRTRR